MKVNKKHKYYASGYFANLYLVLLDSIYSKLSFLFPSIIRNESINRVLLVNCAQLGDIVISTSIIKYIKDWKHDVTIDFLCSSIGKKIIESHPGVSNCYEINHWRQLKSEKNGAFRVFNYIINWLQLRRILFNNKYDLAILLNSFYPSYADLIFFSNCKLKVGYCSGGGGPLLDIAMPKPDGNKKEVNIQLDLVKKSGIYLKCNPQKWILSNYNSNLSIPENYIVIHPGTSNKNKTWPQENWLSLLLMLKEVDYSVVITGQGNTEVDLAKWLSNRARAINLAGKLDWEHWVKVIQDSKLVIGVDSVAGHIASTFSIPFVGIYSGVGDIYRWSPDGDNVKILNNFMPCSPCNTRPCNLRPCINLIKPKHVFSEAINLIEKKGKNL